MKILIVEDEPGIANFIRQGLEEEGYMVTVATEGKPALKLLFDEKFDLVILDWMLPDLSGPEICREFREKDAATPIIFLTAKDTVQDTIDGLQAGANDYIKKPFHFVELLERIKVQWRNRTTETEILQLGDIQIDLQKYEVTKAGTPVNLTQKEFQLLEFLVRNKGRVSERLIGNIPMHRRTGFECLDEATVGRRHVITHFHQEGSGSFVFVRYGQPCVNRLQE